MRARRHALLWLALLPLTSCMTAHDVVQLPADDRLVRDQLIFHTDMRLPADHRLVDELVIQRHDISNRLRLPVADQPINVYLFDSSDRYRKFMSQRFPQFPYRRAFFIENDTDLAIYAFWGERVGEDLRHEVTHGYLHSMVPHLPLWIDEGLAEFFEVPHDRKGVNVPHLELLIEALRQQSWAPSMTRLEQLSLSSEMTQRHYAESWAWMHLLLNSTEPRRHALCNHLARIRMTGSAPPLSETLYAAEPFYNRALVDHLLELQRRRSAP